VKSVNKNILQIYFAIALTVIYYVFIIYLKYTLNSLHWSEYSFFYTGNILNLLLTSILIIGLIVLRFSKKKIENIRLVFLLFLLTIQVISLIIIYLFSKIILFGSDTYLFSFPIKKVYIGVFFISGMICQIYSLTYVWGLLFSSEKFLEIRTLLRTISAVLILLIFALFFVWNTNEFAESNLGIEAYEYAIIPGAAVWSKEKPSPIFEGRIRKALELKRKGKVEKLIVTGGNAPGEISEAEAAKRLLVKLGVDPSSIIIEEQTSTTIEQIKFLRFDEEYKFHPVHIIVVSDGFHLSRILEICKFFNIEASGVASDHSLSLEKTIFYRTREGIALLLFWFFAI